MCSTGVSLKLVTIAALASCWGFGLSAQRQFEEQTVKRYWPGDGGQTEAVVLGDLDGDGDLDAVLGNAQVGQSFVYRNDRGAFTLLAGGLPPLAVTCTSLVLGDVDGDGDLDLVQGNGERFGPPLLRNRLYLNDGSGHFADVTSTHLPTVMDGTQAVGLGDVDGDGDLDLVVGNTNSSQNRLYLNDGTGHFADVTASQLPMANDSTYSLALVDIDGDGDLDIVFGNLGGNALYLNDGLGKFTDATSGRLPPMSSDPQGLAVGDVDGDGAPDLVWGNGAVLSLGEQNTLYLNDGSGNFTDATIGRMPAVSDLTYGALLVDVDADGDLDCLFANNGVAGRPNTLYLNDGTGHFSDASTRLPARNDETFFMAAGDVDADGDPDLVLGEGGLQSGNRLYLNDGLGAFRDVTPAPRLPAQVAPTRALGVSDVDGDGDLDIVVGEYGQRNTLFLNDGRGQFTEAQAQMPTTSDWTAALAVGDVDGDGDSDLFVGNATTTPATRQNQVFLNNGSGLFREGPLLPVDTDDTEAVAMGDVDGDGDLDVVAANAGVRNRLYLNDGTGRFTDATAAGLPADSDQSRAVVLRDLDGDGDLDLVFGNDGQQNTLYLNNGLGKFTDATTGRLPARQHRTLALAAGDLDGDGDVDLVFGEPSQPGLYLNDGTARFVDRTDWMPIHGAESHALVLADVDGDGDLDLVVGAAVGTAGAFDRLYLNDGTAHFSDATVRLPANTDTTDALGAADVDRDGDPDLVVGNSGSDRLLLDLHRQLGAPLYAMLGHPYEFEYHAQPGYATSANAGVTAIGFGLLPAPLQIPSLGTFFLAPPLVDLPSVLIPLAEGSIRTHLPIPNNPSLLGTRLYAQAGILGASLPLHLTGYTADVIIR